MEQTLSDWSLLPLDVLSEIVLKMDTVEEFLNFSVVCQAWNYASSLIKFKWRSRFPWLLLAENAENNHDYSRKLFSLNRNKIYELRLPQTFGGRCFGSSCGWIVVFNLDLQISLFNPLTRDQIFLPPQSTMPNQIKFGNRTEMYKKMWLRRGFILKVFVWEMKKDDLLVIAVHGGITMALAYARPGDQEWTPITTPDVKNGVMDVLYWHGQMLIIYEDGAVGCCDIGGVNDLQPLKALDYLPEPRGILVKFNRRVNSLYMVDSFGDLLMVLRYKIDGDVNDPNNNHEYGEEVEEEEEGEEEEEEEDESYFSYKTTTFEVFKLNFDTKEWEKVNDIGDVALFVGESCSMSIRASNTYNCKRNCIYFTDDEYQFWNAVKDLGGHDMGVFDIETQTFGAFYEGDDKHSDFCTPFWFIPSF